MKRFTIITIIFGGLAVVASFFVFHNANATYRLEADYPNVTTLSPHSCGIGFLDDRHYIRPGGTTSWTVGVTKQDANGDGVYNSSMKFENVPHPEYNWTSYSSSSYVPTLLLANTSYSENVTAYALTDTINLPFGVNDFQIVHTCETSNPEVGLAVGAPANLTVIPYNISGLSARFSDTTSANVVLSWNEFTETSLDHLTVYRVENGEINRDNYTGAEAVATLSPNATSYEIVDADSCRDYYYAVYGFSTSRLLAVSDTVANSQYGAPKPFFLLTPTENSVLNDSLYTFDWEDAGRSYPGENISYAFSLFDASDPINPIFSDTTASSEYAYSSLATQNYTWKVKATNSCGFETYGSSKENIASSSSGGTITTTGGSVTNQANVNDGSHGTGAAFSTGLSEIQLAIPAAEDVNRVRLDYSIAQSGNSVPRTHRLTFFNDTTALGVKRGIGDGLHALGDVSFAPQSSSLLKIGMATDAQDVQSYNGTLYEFEAFIARSDFSVSMRPTTPTSLQCNGTQCGSSVIDASVELACTGSTDPDSDAITYAMEAYYDKNLGTEWGNNGWDLKRKVTITENSGRTLTDYPVVVHVPYDADMNSDFSDLRFVDSTEQQELAYWISNKVDGNFADVRVKVPELPANQDVVLYLYYGNGSASTTSQQASLCPGGITSDVEDNAACWIYRQDFNSDVFSAPYWTRSQGPFYVYTGSGSLRFSEGVPGQWAKYLPPSPLVTVSDHKDVAVETRSRFDTERGRGYKSGYHIILSGTDEVTYAARSESDWVVNNIWTGVAAPDPQTPVWVRMRAWYSADEETLYANVNDGTSLTEVTTVLGNVSAITGLVWRPHWGIEMAVDWVGVRKFSSVEPTVMIDAEEAEDGMFWYQIGSHSESSAYTWDTSGLIPQSNVGLRCRAIDPSGSNVYSSYYDPEAALTILHNTAPVLNPIGDQTVSENDLLEIQLGANDPDPQTLEYGLAGSLPTPYSFSPETGLFQWTPTQFDAGIYPLTFSVTDGVAVDEETIVITVDNLPGPPVLDPIPDMTVSEMGEVSITPHAIDPDNDRLAYTISDSRFTWTGTRFYWRPGPMSAGDFDVTLTVTELTLEGASDEDTFHVTVLNKCQTYDKRNACWVECNCKLSSPALEYVYW
ncbi:MAG: DUF2341 domain-containing protein [Patescibacteria group bacterium]|jgi:hypothetical protein